jgi:hypothetical protein
MNFWRQSTHIMSFFKDENFRGDKRLPMNFMDGFLEVSPPIVCVLLTFETLYCGLANPAPRVVTRGEATSSKGSHCVCACIRQWYLVEFTKNIR